MYFPLDGLYLCPFEKPRAYRLLKEKSISPLEKFGGPARARGFGAGAECH